MMNSSSIPVTYFFSRQIVRYKKHESELFFAQIQFFVNWIISPQAIALNISIHFYNLMKEIIVW